MFGGLHCFVSACLSICDRTSDRNSLDNNSYKSLYLVKNCIEMVTFWPRDLDYYPVWILVKWQTDRQKATHVSPSCNMHRWVRKPWRLTLSRGVEFNPPDPALSEKNYESLCFYKAWQRKLMFFYWECVGRTWFLWGKVSLCGFRRCSLFVVCSILNFEVNRFFLDPWCRIQFEGKV